MSVPQTFLYTFSHANMSRLDVIESFQGIMFPGHMHTEESLNFATNFKFEDTDTLIVTYPKSGNNQMHFYIHF